MRLPSLIGLVLLAFCTPAGAAEDFTGFYAGVHAGYASGNGSERTTLPTPPGASDQRSESALPPSAISAADRMEARRSGLPKAGSR